MQKWIRHLILGVSALTSTVTLAATIANMNSPVGYWKTIDDVTNKPKSILQVTETRDHTIMGRIIKIYPRPGYDQHELCTACEGYRHNKPIVGMVIMQNLKQSEQGSAEWVDGEIMDPLNGKTYHCNFTVMNGGREAEVRGYIGLPLFGRSQTWFRVASPN